MTTLLNGIVFMLLVRSTLLFSHVHSHEGHPWNEWTDAVANAAASGAIDMLAEPPPFRFWAKAEFRPAAWAYTALVSGAAAAVYPPATDNEKTQSTTSGLPWKRAM